jgi:hypothetical protein
MTAMAPRRDVGQGAPDLFGLAPADVRLGQIAPESCVCP